MISTLSQNMLISLFVSNSFYLLLATQLTPVDCLLQLRFGLWVHDGIIGDRNIWEGDDNLKKRSKS